MLALPIRRIRQVHRVMIGAGIVLLLFLWFPGSVDREKIDLEGRKLRYPLSWEHLHLSHTVGGAWYIPPGWLPKDTVPPANLLEAAWLMSKLVNKEPKRYLEETAIPRIIHQTWRSTKTEDFSEKSLEGIEKWLGYATAPETNMAYFMWNDGGVRELLSSVIDDYSYAGTPITLVDLLPRPVEIADIFRVVVCNTIGGVYADIDTIPLRPPAKWVNATDITDWTDPSTGIVYGQHGSTNASFPTQNPVTPVSLILGIEADNTEFGDAFWRMGYTYPVQLTQWSLAARPKQPALNQFLDNFRHEVQKVLDQATSSNSSASSLMKQDPLELTGPVAITKATKDYLSEKTGLRWQGLSGIEDGGRSKVVLDTLILPITGFSPGRSHYGNMGSKPISHVDARVQHAAQGSWRSFHLKVEIGKACRTLLGMCRDWSKVPQ